MQIFSRKLLYNDGFDFILVTIRILFQIASYIVSYIIGWLSVRRRCSLSHFGRTCEKNVLVGRLEVFYSTAELFTIHLCWVPSGETGPFQNVEELPDSQSAFFKTLKDLELIFINISFPVILIP